MKCENSSFKFMGSATSRIYFSSIQEFCLFRTLFEFDYIRRCTKQVNELIQIISSGNIDVKKILISHFSYHTTNLNVDKMTEFEKKSFHHAFTFACFNKTVGKFQIEYSIGYGSPGKFIFGKFIKRVNNYCVAGAVRTTNNRNRVSEFTELLKKNGCF